MDSIKIAVIDDNDMVRRLLIKCLAVGKDPVSEVLFEADSLSGLDNVVLPDAVPDVIFLDVDMPGLKGYDGLSSLLKRFPLCKIIMFTGENDSSTILKCISRGASGYLRKNVQMEEIFNALRAVARGEIYINVSLKKRLRQLRPSV